MIKKSEDIIDASHRLSIDNFTIIKISKSGTGMVVTPGGSWDGVKFTATGTTYHGIVLALKVPRSQWTIM